METVLTWWAMVCFQGPRVCRWLDGSREGKVARVLLVKDAYSGQFKLQTVIYGLHRYMPQEYTIGPLYVKFIFW
jgi:hypothetical protein